MGILVPVMYAAYSEAKKAARYPYSSGLPKRFIGILSAACFRHSSRSAPFCSACFWWRLLSLSVLKEPVRILLTVTPSGATSAANVLAQLMTAALRLFDNAMLGKGSLTEEEETLMMRPVFFLLMPSNAREVVSA